MSAPENIDNSDSEDEVLMDIRNMNNMNSRFQERLLAAQHDALEKQIESEMENPKNRNDDNPAGEIQHLEQMIQKAQREVTVLEKELDDWRQRRNAEATTSFMTTEERALLVEQEKDAISGRARTSDRPLELTLADVDSIFDYLFELGRAPPPQTAAELDNTSSSSLMEPNRRMKEKILMHPDVIQQQKFTHITFTQMDNEFIEEETGEYRKCVLAGNAYNIPFSVSFCVSSSLELSGLDFDVPMDLKVDGRTLLSRIKNEDNLHLFFRLILHYGRLEYDKQRSFEYLMDYYKDTDIRIINEHTSCLVIDTRWDDLQLNLTWTYESAEDTEFEKLDVNICEQFMPRVRLSVISEWRSAQFEAVMNQVPGKFESLAATHGMLSATKLMIGMILQEPFEDKRQQILD